MRSPKRYVAKDGQVSWTVRYRNLTGKDKSETFYDELSAWEFAKLLDAVGSVQAVKYLDDREKAGEERSAITLDQLWAAFFKWKSARRKSDGRLLRVRSERTLMDYERMWKRHVSPHLGFMAANLITEKAIQDWVEELATELAAKTVADYHSLVAQVYGWGSHSTRGLVIQNPCMDTQLPKRRKTQPKGLHPGEWAILYQAAQNVDADVADLLLFLVATGWRWSEAVAVQAMAVDHFIDEAGVSWTYVSMGRVMRREGNHYEFVEDSKSEAGMRRLRVMGIAEDMVLRRVFGKGPTELLLTTHDGNPWRYASFYQRYWTRTKPGSKVRDSAPKRPRVLEEAARLGLAKPVTPHWLRHTHVGMLIRSGEGLTAIQRRLGHASIKTTSDTYGRMIEDASSEGLAKAAAMLGSSSPRELEGAPQ